MKISTRTSLYALGIVVAAIAQAQAQQVTAQQQISMFNPEDFAATLGGPDPDNSVNGFQIRAVNINALPSLEGQGISMALVNLDACAINLPHLHPRATEMSYVIKGNIRMAFVEENGGDGAVVNDLVQGDVTFFPQGLIHYQQNVGCEPATFLAALSNEDPGAVTITTRLFELPTEALQASLNIEDFALKALLTALPEAPAQARCRCLKMCGLEQNDGTAADDGGVGADAGDAGMDAGDGDDETMGDGVDGADAGGEVEDAADAEDGMGEGESMGDGGVDTGVMDEGDDDEEDVDAGPDMNGGSAGGYEDAFYYDDDDSKYSTGIDDDGAMSGDEFGNTYGGVGYDAPSYGGEENDTALSYNQNF